MENQKSGIWEFGDHLSVDEFVRHAGDRVDDMLKAGVSQVEILTRLATVGEIVAGPGASVSILVLDKEGLLRTGPLPICQGIISMPSIA